MFRKKTQGDVWSPYGHESARRALLATRRAQVVLAAIAIAVLYAIFLQLTLSEDTTPSTGSQDIEIPEQKPITVTVTPGRMGDFVNAQSEAPDGQNAPRPVYRPHNKIVQIIQPFLSLLAPLAAALWLLSRVGTSARGKLAELNLGVYKGAMPYEMHTARGYKSVFTYREVDAHVFGKTREDFLFGSYLGAPPLAVRRMLGEEIDGARVTHLRKGGTPRVTVRAPAKRPGLREQLVAPLRDLCDRIGLTRDPRAERLRALKRQERA